MNKRGQIYILVALILAVAFYVLLAKTNIIFEKPIEDNFEELSKNYDLESAKFVNNLLAKGEKGDINNAFNGFTEDFTDYSRRQNPDFGLIYIFNYGDQLYVGNYLAKGDIFIKPEGGVFYAIYSCQEPSEGSANLEGLPGIFSYVGTTPGCAMKIESTATRVYLVVDGILYSLDIEPNRPELVIIGSETKEKQKKVYLDEFINGIPEKNFGTLFCTEGYEENRGGRCVGKDYMGFYSTKLWCEKEGGYWNKDEKVCEHKEV